MLLLYDKEKKGHITTCYRFDIFPLQKEPNVLTHSVRGLCPLYFSFKYKICKNVFFSLRQVCKLCEIMFLR